MSAKRALPAVAGILAIGAAGAWFGLREAPRQAGFQGYVEGHLLLVGPEEGGRIETLAVAAGERVDKDTFVFALDTALQEAQRMEAEARLRQAKAQLANLRSALQRPEQIAVLQAQEERAKAQLDLSRTELERQRKLFERGFTAQARLDQAQTAFERDKAALEEVQRQIEAGRIAGRSAEIAAAEAAVQVAEASLRQAETRLAKRRVTAPTAARIEDVYFRAGEVVNAGQPVLALLPPANRRIRFYVSEPLLSTVSVGAPVGIACDSCPGDLRGTVTFIAREAEFTPPIIFSEQERAKLVFRVEAQPVGGPELPIGLPVSVLPLQRDRRTGA